MDPYMLTLIATGVMFVLATIMYVAFIFMVRGRIRVTTAYLCGEGEEEFRDSLSPGGGGLFWGGTKFFEKMYKALVEYVHTGVIDEWFIYMTLLLALLVIVASAITWW